MDKLSNGSDCTRTPGAVVVCPLYGRTHKLTLPNAEMYENCLQKIELNMTSHNA